MSKGTLRPSYNKATHDRKIGSFYLKTRRKGVNTVFMARLCFIYFVITGNSHVSVFTISRFKYLQMLCLASAGFMKSELTIHLHMYLALATALYNIFADFSEVSHGTQFQKTFRCTFLVSVYAA